MKPGRAREFSTPCAVDALAARAHHQTCYSFEGNAHNERGVIDAMSVDDPSRAVTASVARATE